MNTFEPIDSLIHQLHENNWSLHADFTSGSSVSNVMQHEHFIHLQCFPMVDMNTKTLVVMKIHYWKLFILEIS